MTATATRNLLNARELDARVSDGVHVRLLWDGRDDRLVVTVVDTRRGGAFTIEVPEGRRPLDVFQHPFAYADAAASGMPAPRLR